MAFSSSFAFLTLKHALCSPCATTPLRSIAGIPRQGASSTSALVVERYAPASFGSVSKTSIRRPARLRSLPMPRRHVEGADLPRGSDSVPFTLGALASFSSSPAPASSDNGRRILFCSKCGSPTIRHIPQGDEKLRDVCSDASCGLIHYENPKVVVGAVCLWEGKVLLCKRAIEPCKGLWGFPQGFMELGESTREGAEREAFEEAGARIQIRDLLAVYNIPNQVQVIYLADLLSADISAGTESLEVGLFSADQIPYDQLAFPTVKWALDYLFSSEFNAGSNVPQQRTKVLKLDKDGKSIPGLYKDE